MKEKNNSVINVRLPEDMKAQLKQKLGYNMSGIMKEHFQKLLDVKEFENRNKCFVCKEQHAFNDCSFFCLINEEDKSREYYIFCNECMKNPDLKDFNEQGREIIKLFIQEALKNKHPEHLEHLSKMANEHASLCEVKEGSLYFSKEFNAKIEESKNPESTHTHNREPIN